MTTHTVTSNANPASIQLRESLEDNLGQFLSDIAIHIIALVIRSLGSINVETGARAEIISIILALNVQAAYQRISKPTKNTSLSPQLVPLGTNRRLGDRITYED